MYFLEILDNLIDVINDLMAITFTELKYKCSLFYGPTYIIKIIIYKTYALKQDHFPECTGSS